MLVSVMAELERCVGVVERYRHLVDTCMVSFIEDQLFSLLSVALQAQLLALSESQIASLPSLLTRKVTLRMNHRYW
jgi:hypothetical protein